jgi:hypothetical protein
MRKKRRDMWMLRFGGRFEGGADDGGWEERMREKRSTKKDCH